MGQASEWLCNSIRDLLYILRFLTCAEDHVAIVTLLVRLKQAQICLPVTRVPPDSAGPIVATSVCCQKYSVSVEPGIQLLVHQTDAHNSYKFY